MYKNKRRSLSVFHRLNIKIYYTVVVKPDIILDATKYGRFSA